MHWQQRKAEPGDDIVSALVHAKVDGTPLLSDVEVAGAIQMVSGGFSTTAEATSNIVVRLIAHPTLEPLLRDRPDLIPERDRGGTSLGATGEHAPTQMRVQTFDGNGTFLGEMTDMCRPNGVAIDTLGNVYVAEFGGLIGRYAWAGPPAADEPWSRVSIWSPDLQLAARWGTADGREPGSFFAAHAIAVDSKGDFYVSQVNWSAGAKNRSLPDDNQVI